MATIDSHPARRPHSRAERIADGCVHALGVSAAVAGTIFMLASSTGAGLGRIAAVFVYSLGLVASFSASAAYNLGFHSRWRALLRRCDHAAIFLLIAGTYTPFTMQFSSSGVAGGSTAAIWAICMGGIALKLGAPVIFERVSVGIYLAVGWGAVLLLWLLAHNLSLPSIAAMTLGGALYTTGVGFHCWDRLKYQNVIWHAFVLLAASAHYVAVFTGVVAGAA